jgi:Uma2 family endonuclease
MIATLPSPQPPQHLLLHDISWDGYETLLDELEGLHYRVTYDRGALEIMPKSHEHEVDGELLADFVRLMTMELNIPLRSGGSTTLKDALLEKGLEPDKCFWIQHERHMRCKRKFDLRRDPPPDLVLENEVTRSALDRVGIYAALRVPEVWRSDGQALHVHHLTANGKYREKQHSLAFPFLPIKKLLAFLRQADTVDETTLMRSFVQWVRDELAPAFQKHAGKNGKRPGK